MYGDSDKLASFKNCEELIDGSNLAAYISLKSQSRVQHSQLVNRAIACCRLYIYFWIVHAGGKTYKYRFNFYLYYL